VTLPQPLWQLGFGNLQHEIPFAKYAVQQTAQEVVSSQGCLSRKLETVVTAIACTMAGEGISQ
jgi:hypothetical protein